MEATQGSPQGTNQGVQAADCSGTNGIQTVDAILKLKQPIASV